ncbi:MAG: hypothetical protein D5R98_06835 [Desulfonatronovibrio sp. MSAO_Bac4]|nr:MAG: hypothetical protein D5R98_06835 [Desulfonatronovibrio sp. MSAO_Bac4]
MGALRAFEKSIGDWLFRDPLVPKMSHFEYKLMIKWVPECLSPAFLKSSSPGRPGTEPVSNFKSLSLFWKLGQSPRGTIKKLDAALVPGRNLL